MNLETDQLPFADFGKVPKLTGRAFSRRQFVGTTGAAGTTVPPAPTFRVAGLATDFCVAWMALDARALGFETLVIEDACRAIDLNGSLAAAWKEMTAKGVKRIQSSELI